MHENLRTGPPQADKSNKFLSASSSCFGVEDMLQGAVRPLGRAQQQLARSRTGAIRSLLILDERLRNRPIGR